VARSANRLGICGAGAAADMAGGMAVGGSAAGGGRGGSGRGV